MTGHIYKIVNNINGKVYIGKTLQTVNTRWEKHLYDALRLNQLGEYKYDFKFYRAIRKYGADNFTVFDLGKFEASELNDLEIQAIKMYNSYYTGYNSTLGGDGNRTARVVTELDIKVCVEMYRDGNGIYDIHSITGIPHRTIMKILGENIPKEVRNNTNRRKPLAILDKKGNILRTFESMWVVCDWLRENYNPNIVDTNVYYLVKKAALNGNTAYGHHWIYL